MPRSAFEVNCPLSNRGTMQIEFPVFRLSSIPRRRRNAIVCRYTRQSRNRVPLNVVDTPWGKLLPPALLIRTLRECIMRPQKIRGRSESNLLAADNRGEERKEDSVMAVYTKSAIVAISVPPRDDLVAADSPASCRFRISLASLI